MFTIETDSQGILTLMIKRADKPMNVVDSLFLKGLQQIWNKIERQEGLKGVIITSGNPEFVAGADLMFFLKSGAPEIRELIASMHQIFRRIEKSPFPVVAAVNGTCLGGGYELALACHHRVALNGPKIQIGLPEVSLGLLPGAGGTQRLPRMIGVEKALPLITEGTRLKPEQALAQGLVQELRSTSEEMLASAKAWIHTNPKVKQPWDLDQMKFGLNAGTAKFGSVMKEAILQKTGGDYPAPLAILSSVLEGMAQPFEQALQTEQDYFLGLATSKVAKNMIRTLFFGANAFSKGASRPKNFEKRANLKVSLVEMESAVEARFAASNVTIEKDPANADLALTDLKSDVSGLKNAVRTTWLQPVDKNPVVEIVQDACVGEELVAAAFDALLLIKKSPLLVKGDFVGRILFARDEEKGFCEKEQVSSERAIKRVIFRQSIEAVKCWEEGLISSARDADVASVLGWGFPSWAGGVLSYVDFLGAKTFTEECLALSKQAGERFAPPKMLLGQAGSEALFEH